MGDYIFGPPPPPPPRANGLYSASQTQALPSGNRYNGGYQQSAVRSGRESNTSSQIFSTYNQTGPYQHQQPQYSTPYSGNSMHVQQAYSSNSQPYGGSSQYSQGYAPSSYLAQQQQSQARVNSYNPAAYSYKAAPTSERKGDYADRAPEELAGTDGVVRFRGTTISLQTEEDIEKWISERKKNWPSARRIEEKEEEKKLQKSHSVKYEKGEPSKDSSDNRRPCKFFSKAGKCSRGQKCRFRHELSDQKSNHSLRKYKRYDKPAKMPLFKRLVQNDWDKENDKVLGFISYLVDTGVISREKAINQSPAIN